MSWFSVLPPYLTAIETWIIRLFVSSQSRNGLAHPPVHRQFQYHTALPLQMLWLSPLLLLSISSPQRIVSYANESEVLTSLFQLLLTLATLGPWFLFILYDIVLWFSRAVAYEIPLIGGRAQGKRRPRRPTFSERPPPRPVRAFTQGFGDVVEEVMERTTSHDSIEEEGANGDVVRQKVTANGTERRRRGLTEVEGDDHDAG